MRRLRKTCITLALVAGLVTWGVGAGTSAAQEHHGDHGGHDHPTTTPSTTVPSTTVPPSSTSSTSTTQPPSSSTTRPPGSTTTTVRPSTTTVPTTPGAETRVIRYGPFTIPAAQDNADGTHGHSHTGNRFNLGIEKPCTNCYLTGIQADLVYEDGSQAGYSTDAQLHHMVMFNRDTGRTDATCGSSFLGLLGQRFFASGDERTPVTLPNGYGYRLSPSSQWNMIWDLSGTSREDQQVYFEVTYDYVPGSRAGMTDVEPVWLDIDQCGTSTYSAPAGPSEETYTWTVNRPGRLLTIGGHLHDGGTHLTVVNDATGRLICDSVAGYGETPLYVDHHGDHHLSSMSGCVGTRERPLETLRNGQRVTIHSFYELDEPADDVMGIAVGYLERSSSPQTPQPPWWWPWGGWSRGGSRR